MPGPLFAAAWAERAKAPWREASDLKKGIALVLAVTFFFSCMDSCAKAMGERYEPLMVVWWRYATAAALSALLFAPSLTQRLRTPRLGVQIARSALLFAATICFFYGFAAMPQADVVAVAQVSPLAITGFAALFLGEKVGPWRWAGVAMGFAGAMLILKPGFSDVGWAAAFPFVGALLFSAYGVATKFLSEDEDPWTTFLYTGSVGALGATAILPFVWETPDWADVPVLLGAGVFGALGQGTLIFAFLLAPASLLAPYLYVGLIWATLFGFAFFGQFPDVWTISGALVIVGAGLFVQWRETLAPPDQPR